MRPWIGWKANSAKDVKNVIYITGDTHGDFSGVRRFCEYVKSSADDTMIILGDAGFNYYGGYRDETTKMMMSQVKMTFFCIHGNHEIRPSNIPTYRIREWRGGKVYAEDAYPNLLFAIDGEIYDLDGRQTIVIGGAYSVDKPYRLLAGSGWWPDEQPSDEIKAKVEKVLEARGWKVDAVLSHTVPLKYEPREAFIPGFDQKRVDKSTEIWLNSIENRLDYGHWYAGHYHVDKSIDKLTIMFGEVQEWK